MREVKNSYKKFFILLLFSGLMVSISGCGLFQTRKPQDPLSSNSSSFVQPDDPTIVIENLQNAIKNLNVQNYLRCLSDTGFEFHPSQNSQTNYADIWNGWSKINEQTYFINLQAASQSTGNQLQLTNTSFEIQSSTTQQYKADYSLTVIHNRVQNGVPTVANGQLIFLLKQADTGLWYIQSWTDISSSGGANTFTWSDLKAIFFKS